MLDLDCVSHGLGALSTWQEHGSFVLVILIPNKKHAEKTEWCPVFFALLISGRVLYSGIVMMNLGEGDDYSLHKLHKMPYIE
ncbi:hypothetical protein I79_007526 [Cricetulus griseus]|uniref:Uncharacterized protein n=1 Tax=Cricetulus griseus TaxID=10029 RepID=G3HAR8_CRIGR|nr:hypothetical protein I79_007526 [Cricetulus griseus]